MSRPGLVHLVGAGPGDADLLTVRGWHLLRQAKVVIHDRLVARDLLAIASPLALHLDVGKQPGMSSPTQDEINALIVQHAQAGRRVVRLKGGDPFLFGRGFEEYEACRRAGVTCLVVPGVSSAVAGPASAGIPVTHRGAAHSLAVMTGASAESGTVPSELPAADTIIILMGRRNLPDLVTRMLSSGRSPVTPAACIANACTPRQRVVRATLASMTDAVDRAGLTSPMIAVVGRVAELGQGASLHFPLAGRHVLVTAAARTARRLSRGLRRVGAVPIVAPAVRIRYPELGTAFTSALSALAQNDWLVLPSAHAVQSLLIGLDRAGLDVRRLAGVHLAAVGPGTAARLRRASLQPSLVPAEHTGRGLAADLVKASGGTGRVLVLQSNRAGQALPAQLAATGLAVATLQSYQTDEVDRATPPVMSEGVDAVTFCSPSAVDGYLARASLPESAVTACIGPRTAAALAARGRAPDVVARASSCAGLIRALEACFARRPVECR